MQTSPQQSGKFSQTIFVNQPQFAMPTTHVSNFPHNFRNTSSLLDNKIGKLASEEKDAWSIGGENSFPGRENGCVEKTFSTIVPYETQVLRAEEPEENNSSSNTSDIDAQKEFYLVTKFTTEQFERLEQEFHKKNNPENYEIIQLANR